MNSNQRTHYQGQQLPFYGHQASRSGVPPSRTDVIASRKRAAHSGSLAGQMANGTIDARNKQIMLKKKKLSDKVLPHSLQDLVPESQAYMDLLSFERKLDSTITRKRLDIQEALKRPLKVKCKLRIFISNQCFPAKSDAEVKDDNSKASWELRVEGRLLDDPVHFNRSEGLKPKRKFSSFFKSLVIELDKDLYGPDNHLVEWHRTPSTQETDGFQVKRHGEKNVRCTMLFMLNHLPPQFKVDSRLGKLLGIYTLSRPKIMESLWQYIKLFNLQDSHEREFINCDSFLEQIFGKSRVRFAEIPQLLQPLLHPPDPIVIHHVISVNPADAKKQSLYDIDVEIDDSLKTQMSSFLLSTTNQQEISELDKRIHDTVATVKQHRIQREFYMGFSENPQEFVTDWTSSQTRDLKTMTDATGSKTEERDSDFYYSPWSQEAVTRYFYSKVQQRRLELEQALKSSNI